MKKLIQDLCNKNAMQASEASNILSFFFKNFEDKGEVIIQILDSVVKDYPCTLNEFYEFCKEIVKVMPEFTELKTLYALYCSLAWYGVCHESRVKSIKRSMQLLKSF